MAKRFDTSNKTDLFDLKLKEQEKVEKAAKEFAGKYPMNTLVEIPLEMISIGKNIRDDEIIDSDLKELGESILQNGQIEPAIVYYNEKDNKYILKIGHRRYKACYAVGKTTLKCIISESFKDEVDRIVTQAIENEHRLNMSPVEREKYIKNLLDLGLKQEEIAKKLNKNKGFISEALKAYNVRTELSEIIGTSLTEEPSTRSMWKASTLSPDAVKRAIENASVKGGTKKDFKDEIEKEFKARKNDEINEEEENIEFNIDFDEEYEIEQKKLSPSKTYSIMNKVTINENEKKVTIEKILGSDDEELNLYLQQKIKEFYSEKGYSFN